MMFVLNHAELQPINGEVFTGSSSNIQDGARLDIVANGFWGGRFECTFFDVQVFNPHAPSNRNSQCYRKHKLEKKRQYKQRVREVEHASFTPLVLSATQICNYHKVTSWYMRIHNFNFAAHMRPARWSRLD